MSTDWNLIELSDLGLVRLRGPDAVTFMQGQVSNDVARLTPERGQLAGYHNPQGRAIAVLRLVQLESDDLLAILPRELAAGVASRLSKFVLRAKVKITDESAAWRIAGLVAPESGGYVRAAATPAPTLERASTASAPDPATIAQIEARARNWAQWQFAAARASASATGEVTTAAAQLEGDSVVELPRASALLLPDEVNAQSRSSEMVVVRVGMTSARWIVLSPSESSIPLAGCVPAERDAWRLLDIADGQPQVYATTSEEFVAQMLNLDALGGIAFDKGCYTGQEVIARAHYRGRVKRRMQRFMTRTPERLVPGQSGKLADGRSFKVVEAANLANGRCEFLAVASFGVSEADGSVEAAGVPGGSADSQSEADSRIDAEALPLPYELPA